MEQTYIRNSNGVENLLGVKVPQTKRVCMANSKTGLQDTDGLNKVRGKNEFLLPVNAQSVRRVLLVQNVEVAFHILGPLVDDVEVLVGFNQTARGGAQGRAHVGDIETPIRLSTDFIRNGGKKSTIALLELGPVRVGRVEVKRSVLGCRMRQMLFQEGNT